MAEVLLFALSMALGIVVTRAVVRRDLGRLTGERLERAWPDSTAWMAVVLLGPLCLPIHFIRTRRSWAGVGLALAWTLGTLVATELPVQALDWLFDVSPEVPAAGGAPRGNKRG